MKKISDYKGDDALDLWLDLIEPMTNILGDPKVAEIVKSKKPPLLIAKEILKGHKKDAVEILLRIDPEPIDGINILARTIGVVLEFINSPDFRYFFVSAGQGQTELESSGSAMEIIEEKEN